MLKKTSEAQAPPKMKRKEYEKELHKLQVDLCHLQTWIKHKGIRAIVVFEGRDAAGKGGTIKALTERLSPRSFRVVALPAPTERQKAQMYMQRYIEQFPARGEVVIFDRSWYNRAGVERVMGFSTDEQCKKFLEQVSEFEKYITDADTILIKLWLEVGMKEQERRFEARIEDPLRQWKLSPMDIESYRLWYDYSHARDDMLRATHSKHAPWHIVRSDNKRQARLNAISHIVETIGFKKVAADPVKLPKRSKSGAYDDTDSFGKIPFVEQRY